MASTRDRFNVALMAFDQMYDHELNMVREREKALIKMTGLVSLIAPEVAKSGVNLGNVPFTQISKYLESNKIKLSSQMNHAVELAQTELSSLNLGKSDINLNMMNRLHELAPESERVQHKGLQKELIKVMAEKSNGEKEQRIGPNLSYNNFPDSGPSR